MAKFIKSEADKVIADLEERKREVEQLLMEIVETETRLQRNDRLQTANLIKDEQRNPSQIQAVLGDGRWCEAAIKRLTHYKVPRNTIHLMSLHYDLLKLAVIQKGGGVMCESVNDYLLGKHLKPFPMVWNSAAIKQDRYFDRRCKQWRRRNIYGIEYCPKMRKETSPSKLRSFYKLLGRLN